MEIPIHKLHYIGMSGIIFTKCEIVTTEPRTIRTTSVNSKVTCAKCRAAAHFLDGKEQEKEET